jgi:hypothetical protein
MKKWQLFILGSLLGALIGSCTMVFLYSSNRTPGIIRVRPQRVRWVESANPWADADSAIRHSNRRLAAVGGFTVEVPGLPDSVAWDSTRYFMIPETSEILYSEDDPAYYITFARWYAHRYNERVLALLKNKGSSVP